MKMKMIVGEVIVKVWSTRGIVRIHGGRRILRRMEMGMRIVRVRVSMSK